MICGNFTFTDDGFTGEIRFFGKREQVVLLPIEDQDNEKAPHFRIVAADDERIEFGAALGASQLQGAPGRQVKRPAALEDEGGTIGEADHAEGGIVDVEAGSLRHQVGQLVERRAADGHGFGVTHQPPGPV